MKIIFQKNDFNLEKQMDLFSKSNPHNAGAIFSFIGKVRPLSENKKIISIDIELYEKMAMYQTKKIILSLRKKYSIIDCLLIHRYGRIKPGQNIVLLLVSSEHRKQSFKFSEELIDWLKVKVTFWKKENFSKNSKWVSQKETDRKVLKTSSSLNH